MGARTLLVVMAGLLAVAPGLGCKKTDDGAVADDDEAPKKKKKKVDPEDVWEQGGPIPVKSTDPQIGPRTAPVTIVVWTDLQCPFCKKLDGTLRTLRTRYGHDLRVVFREFPLPFHKDARAAAEAAQMVLLAKGSEAYARFAEKAFAHQTALGRENLEAWMAELGVDAPSEALREKAKARVDADVAAGTALGVKGTPMSFVDCKAVSGAQSEETFATLVDAHLLAAKELAVKPTKVYETLCEKFYAPSAPVPTTAEDPTVHKVDLAGAPVEGPKDALVTVVTFGDYQCPFCKRLDDALVLLRKDFPAKVRLAFRHEPLAFHKRAVPAAHLALEALAQKGSPGFWSVHHALFASQPHLDDPDLAAVAKAQGLDVPKAMAAVAAATWGKELTRDHTAAVLLSVKGTPTSFVNGRRFDGAQPYPKLKTFVEDRLVEAEKLVKDGVAPDKVYDELMKTAK